jgi:hypothetical protein
MVFDTPSRSSSASKSECLVPLTTPPDDKRADASGRKFQHHKLVTVGMGSLHAVRRPFPEVFHGDMVADPYSTTGAKILATASIQDAPLGGSTRADHAS